MFGLCVIHRRLAVIIFISYLFDPTLNSINKGKQRFANFSLTNCNLYCRYPAFPSISHLTILVLVKLASEKFKRVR